MNFFLDHDVPDEVEQLLRYWKHEVQRLREVLPITALDEAVFDFAQQHQRIIISCNRNDFLQLARTAIAKGKPFAGLIILVRRRTRQAECAHLLTLLRRAGESGLTGNINLA
jgi:predicted nuclease of predicted toxin-antitoxin system